MPVVSRAIRPGMLVMGADGIAIGTVKATDKGRILIDREGTRFVSVRLVAAVMNNEVRLSARANVALKRDF